MNLEGGGHLERHKGLYINALGELWNVLKERYRRMELATFCERCGSARELVDVVVQRCGLIDLFRET